MEKDQAATNANRGEFFAMCIDTARDIVRAGGKAEEVISYMVLARHTQGRGKYKYMLSTAGANAIAAKAGISYRSATKVLDWLSRADRDRPAFIFNREKAVLPDDIKYLPRPVLAHRLILNEEEKLRGETPEHILEEINSRIPVPA